MPHPSLINAHCYHQTSPGRAIVAINSVTIFAPTRPSERPLPRSDGWWGPHEYAILPQPLDESSPYLAWIPSTAAYLDPLFQRQTGLDPALTCLSYERYPLLPVTDIPSTRVSVPRSSGHNITELPAKPDITRPSKSRPHQLFRTSSDFRNIVREKVTELTACVAPIISTVEADVGRLSIRIPEQAVFRLEQASLWSRLHNSEAGHRLVLAGLKRAALELHGFILWHHDQSKSNNSNATPQSHSFAKGYSTRGLYVNTIPDYDRFSRFGIAVFMVIDLDQVEFPSDAQHVDLSPIPVERNRLFPDGYSGGHHCYLYFYPPIIEDSVHFELAARGYHSRSDVYSSNRDIEKLFENISKDSCEHLFHIARQ